MEPPRDRRRTYRELLGHRQAGVVEEEELPVNTVEIGPPLLLEVSAILARGHGPYRHPVQRVKRCRRAAVPHYAGVGAIQASQPIRVEHDAAHALSAVEPPEHPV